MTTKEKIETINKHGYHLDFGTVFNQAFDIYKKMALNAGLALLIISILIGIVAMGSFFIFLGISFSITSLQGFKVENFSALGLFGYILAITFFSAVMSPLSAGLIQMAQDAAKQKEVSFGTVFHYYQTSYFKEIFVATLLIGLLSNLFSSGLQFAGYQWLGFVISMFVALLTFLTLPLIIFGNLKAIDAIQGSIIMVSKQPLLIAGLLIVSGLFLILGLVALCIGIFFTMPMIYAMHYVIYASIINDTEATPEATSEELI